MDGMKPSQSEAWQQGAVRFTAAELDKMMEAARRDDWHRIFVGSEVRVLIGMAQELLRSASAEGDTNDQNRPVRIEVNGSVHIRTAQQWLELARADLASKAPESAKIAKIADLKRQLTAEREGRMLAKRIVDEVRALKRELEAITKERA